MLASSGRSTSAPSSVACRRSRSSTVSGLASSARTNVPLTTEDVPVPDFGIDGGAAARGNHHALASQELFQYGALAATECGLALIPEDSRDLRAPVALDLHIRISRRPSQPLGKALSDACLARATESDQDDPIDAAHVPLEF